MKRPVALLSLLVLSLAGAAEAPTGEVFREPFTLKLRVDQEHFYEQKINARIPYVHGGMVFLFCGESFGVKLVKDGDRVVEVRYEPEEKAADLFLKFSQEKINDGWSTMLKLENRTTDRLHVGAAMAVRERKDPFETSILPLGPGMTNYKTWPHPIVQLILRDIWVMKETGKDAAGAKVAPVP